MKPAIKERIDRINTQWPNPCNEKKEALRLAHEEHFGVLEEACVDLCSRSEHMRLEEAIVKAVMQNKK